MEHRADLILANRSYVDHAGPPGEAAPIGLSEGGLLEAVRPVIAGWDGASGTTWIGAARGPHDREWTGPEGFEFVPTPHGSLRHRRLFFDPATWAGHYVTVANSFLWPLLHLIRIPLPEVTSYYPQPERLTREAWEAYREVNRRFAEAACEETTARTCWVHDYQLALVPGNLRSLGFRGQVGFYLHTPFPALGVVAPFLDEMGRGALAEFVEGMLGADVVGLQSESDVDRFVQACETLAGAKADGSRVEFRGRTVRVGAYPVGIDAGALLDVARTARLPGVLTQSRTPGSPLVVGLERCDFTKGIPERLATIASAYRSGERFDYVGVAAPTREGIGVYAALDRAMAAAVAGAEEAAKKSGASFQQLRRAIPWPEVVALLRDADVVFTSSLSDGMNLVPLQAAIAQSLRPPGRRAVIITGQDAGVSRALAAYREDGFVPVDPLDPEMMASVFKEALLGRPARVSDRLIEALRTNDASAWASRFLGDLEAVPC
jgi:trehalose-6-phosphate synthase